jgi:N-acetylneuraminic acid mutarotase
MVGISRDRFGAIRSLLLVGVIALALVATTAKPALAAGTFQKTGSMNVARTAHRATLLTNGQVLVAGGQNGSGTLASAELYNPATGTWAFTGNMNVPRENHQAVLLQNGQVLVAGGDNASGTLASAELYNPATGTWAMTGSMSTARSQFSLTLLGNGEVLAVAGTSADLYNPTTGTWSATGSPTSSVGGPNAALLQDGQVLAIGESLNSPSELYNPSTGSWSATGSMPTTMINAITPRLLNGEVFVTGGFQYGNTAVSTAALYDPSTGQYTLETGPCSCAGFNGAVLQTGKVLVAGGTITMPGNPYPTHQTINSAELWNLSTQSWTNTGNLHDSRSDESVTVLSNGQALVAGGEQITKQSNSVVILASAELYTP